MSKTDRPLEVEIPRPGADGPVWSRVGIIGLCGFVLGVAWPHFANVKVGPNVPADLAARAESSASAAASAPRPPASAGAPAPSGSAAPPGADGADAEDAPPPQNQEMVVIGPGKITKCQDKKDKKIDDCEKLLFDPIAIKRLKELAKCPSAMGLAGKISIGFEVNFGTKAIQVSRMKKGTTLPSSTLDGVVQCAAREFGNASLEDVPHKHRKYTLVYNVTFYPPGKHPEVTPTGADATDGDPAAGSTTSEAEASGTAIIAWDTALLRKDPKDGEVVARIVRGTKVKIVGKQTDWYKVESGSKVGWVYRGAIGL
jgi:Bacterial SH3 domain